MNLTIAAGWCQSLASFHVPLREMHQLTLSKSLRFILNDPVPTVQTDHVRRREHGRNLGEGAVWHVVALQPADKERRTVEPGIADPVGEVAQGFRRALQGIHGEAHL